MQFEKGKVLRDYSTFKIGGKCDYFFSPEQLKDVLEFFKKVNDKNIPFFVLGGGSNLLISDGGFRGAILHTKKLKRILIFKENENEVILKAQCGAAIKDLIIFCKEYGLSGLEEFYGLPGSVGGAAFMNVRCYGKEFSDVVIKIDALDLKKEEIISLGNNEIFLGYKNTLFQRNRDLFILNIYFKLNRADSGEILKKMIYYISDREKKGQFKFPNAGCIFKNNRNFGKPTGKILEELGLKGVSKGGVKFYEKHANFIVNFDNGKAEDVLYLIELAKKRVYEDMGFRLETEISFLGEF